MTPLALSCHKQLQHVARWLDQVGIRENALKCHPLATHVTPWELYDPKLNLQGDIVPFIGHGPVKHLGAFIQVPPDQQTV